MDEYTFCIATQADKANIISFMNTHWGSRHPLVNNEEFFSFYYTAEKGKLNFALAKHGEKIAALAGFVPASHKNAADIWVSIWVADKAMSGSGLELMDALPNLTGARSVSCNNIRPNTRPFYEFLGYTTGRVNHFYRLARKPEYTVAVVHERTILPTENGAVLKQFENRAELLASGFVPLENRNPYKDSEYILKRYFDFPYQKYMVFGAYIMGGKLPFALLVARVSEVLETNILRIVDYIGDESMLPQLGGGIDKLMRRFLAEYADIYCAGIAEKTLNKAGFVLRETDTLNIIPNYLEPLLRENTDFYYFTNKPDGFVLFKADGDQDRPNIQA